MQGAKRLFLAMMSASMLLVVSAAPVSVLAVGNVQVTLACSDGTSTDLTVDSATLPELRDAVEAMTLYPTGLSCSLAEVPLGTVLGFLNNVALAAGKSDFAVGGGRYACGTGFVNFSVSAHRHENGKVNGTVRETIPQDIPSCGLTKGHFVADVQCFTAVGPDGWGVAEFTQVSGYYAALPTTPGDTVRFGARDNDPTPAPDQWNNTLAGATCPGAPFTAFVPITHGNIVVRDNIP